MDRQASNKKRIATAAGKALLIWLLFYFILSQIFVVWKWQTPPSPSVVVGKKNTTTTATPPREEDDTKNDEALLQQRLRVLTETIERLKIAISTTRARNMELDEQLDLVNQRTRQLQQQQQKQQINEQKDDDEKTRNKQQQQKEDDDTDDSFLKLRELLSVSDLSDFTSARALSDSFHRAIQEIELAMKDDNNNYGNLLANMLSSSSFPDIKKSPVVIAADNTVVATTTNKKKGGITEADLQMAQITIRNMIGSQRQSKSLPFSLEETVPTIEHAIQRAVENIQTTILASSSSSSSNSETKSRTTTSSTETTTTTTEENNKDCLTSLDPINHWVDAGLDALYKQQDMRRALLRALEEDGIDTSHFILDADLLPDDGSNKSPSAASSRYLSVRDWLDRPTLHHSAIYVDQLLDFVSGRHDVLDEFLDKYVFAHVADDEPVGNLVVAKLLDLAGKVNATDIANRLVEATTKR